MKTNLVHVYTGEGKGKTTAAVGLALRAAGWGKKTLIIQFMKGREGGIKHCLDQIEEIELVSYGREQFVSKGEITAQDEQLAQAGLERFESALEEDFDIIILDELCVALNYGLLTTNSVLKRLKEGKKELVLTGRQAPPAIIEVADYVSRIKNVKHPYEKGVKARKGIEY